MIQNLSKLAKGLFRLKGIDRKYGDILAKNIVDAKYPDNDEVDYLDSWNIMRYIKDVVNRTIGIGPGRVNCIGDLYLPEVRFFKDDKKEFDFRGVKLTLEIDTEKSSGLRMASYETFGYGSGRIVVYLNKLMRAYWLETFEALNQKELSDFITPIIAHEMRHAADRLFLKYREVPSIEEEQNENLDYYNRPTELKSYAGTIADYIVSQLGEKAENIQYIRFFNSFGRHQHILDKIKPENKKEFLLRVYNEMRKKAENLRLSKGFFPK